MLTVGEVGRYNDVQNMEFRNRLRKANLYLCLPLPLSSVSAHTPDY